MALTCKQSLSGLVPGDYVWAKYTASSGAVGSFSDIATKTDAEVGANAIPVLSTATPNGYAKFICVGEDYLGRKKLVCDRNIQHSISWNTLNTEGIATGNGVSLQNESYTAKYGGTAYSLTTFSTFTPDLAFDGNTDNTYWQSTASAITNEWIAYIYPSTQHVDKIIITKLNSEPTNFFSTYKIQGSNNSTTGANGTWTDLTTTITANSSLLKEEIIISADYKAYRIIGAHNGSSTSIRVKEVQICTKYMLFPSPNTSVNLSLRLLTGGVSSTDKDNEWDKILVESTLNGTVTAGSNSIWNFSDTMNNMTSTRSTAGLYVVRGINGNPAQYGTNTTSDTTDYLGFRPILILESLASSKYLIKDGSLYYKVVSGTRSQATIAGGTPTEAEFQTEGMDSLSGITGTHLSGLTAPKILYYKV